MVWVHICWPFEWDQLVSAFLSPMVSRIGNTDLIPFLGHDGYLHKKEHPVLHKEHGCMHVLSSR